MPKVSAQLKDVVVKSLAKQPGRHPVGGVAGLHLLVTKAQPSKDAGQGKGMRKDIPKCSASWVLRVMVNGRRRDLGLGSYRDIGLQAAREHARELRKQIRIDGIDPVEARRQAAAEVRQRAARRLTFEEAAKGKHADLAPSFRNDKHSKQWISTLETYAFPVIGHIDVAEITPLDVQRVLKPIWMDKTETATRVRQRIEAALDWAAVAKKARSGDNPARWRGNLDQLLPKPSQVKQTNHFRALPWAEMPAFMGQLTKREGMAAQCLLFTIHTAVRSGEARMATWSEIDLKAKTWTIPAARMKARKEHRVPLSAEAVAILKAVPRMKGTDLVFPSSSNRPLSDMSLSAVLRRMDAACTVHGFRSTFRDWVGESTSYPLHLAEAALAHALKNKVEAAYARGDLLAKRAKLMQAWSSYMNSPRQDRAGVVPIKGAGT